VRRDSRTRARWVPEALCVQPGNRTRPQHGVIPRYVQAVLGLSQPSQASWTQRVPTYLRRFWTNVQIQSSVCKNLCFLVS